MARFLRALDFTTHSEQTGIAQTAVNPAPALIGSLETPNAGSESTAAHAEPTLKRVEPKTAKSIRLLWCDTAGIRRCRVVTGHRYGGLQHCGLGITTACMAMPAYGDSPAPNAGLTAVGEARMKPVESSRVALPWCPGHQMAVVEFEAPRSETPWDCCPRRALRNTCKMLQDNFGLTMKAGFEIEFLLLERAPPGEESLRGSGWRPVDGSLYCQSSALDRQARVLDHMVEALEAMDIEVVQWHAESAPGQFEISLMYGDPVEVADKLLLAKEALVGVAGSHGLAVSFLPKPVPDAAGSGLHVHFSLWKNGKCHMNDPLEGGSFSSSPDGLEAAARAVITAAADTVVPHPEPELPPPRRSEPTAAAAATAGPGGPLPSARARRVSATGHEPAAGQGAGPRPHVPSLEMLSFLGGVLAYLDVLLPFTAPSPNSYERLRPGAWAGAHAAWGYNNREVPLRVTAPGPHRLDMMHVEYKAMDGTANPYVALSAIMVAGMLGIFAKLSLPEPCQVAPGELDAEAAARVGVRPLPTSLGAALGLLKSERTGVSFKAAMAEAIGQPLLDAYLAVREAEVQQAPNDNPRDMLLRYS